MAKRLAGRYGYPKDDPFAPTFHEDRIEEPFTVGKPSMIFVSSMGDLFGDWVPKEWIERVIEVTRHCDRHIYQFLTKNPKRYSEFDFPQNCWLGASSTGANSVEIFRALRGGNKDNVKFLSWEPMFEPLSVIVNKITGPPDMPDVDYVINAVDWLIMGAMTGTTKNKYPKPEPEWIKNAVYSCRDRGVPVFMKKSIKPHWKGELIQERPK
jgi:protein gp37